MLAALISLAASVWSRASRAGLIAVACLLALAIAFGAGWQKGSSHSQLRTEIAALQAERDAARRDLASFRAHAARVAEDAERRARESEARAARLQAFVEAGEVKEPVDAPTPPPRPALCPPCRDRVGHDDARRLRDLAK